MIVNAMGIGRPKHGELELAKQYRVPANLVRTHLLDLFANGRRTFDLDESVDAHEQVRRMLLLGGRYAQRPDRSLDSSGSTSDDLRLAEELVSLVPWRIKELREHKDMQEWARWASEVLSLIEAGAAFEDFPEPEQRFAREELLPLLQAISEQPPDEPSE
jgi:hypothetical protein